VPQYLRMVRKSKWYKNTQTPWLLPDDLQADALSDLRTHSNKLSVWEVEDGSLDLVIASLAATREHVANFEYALFSSETISRIGVRLIRSEGECCNGLVAKHMHRDLLELTAGKIMQLAKTVSATRVTRVYPRQIVELVKIAVNSGSLDPIGISETMKKALGQ